MASMSPDKMRVNLTKQNIQLESIQLTFDSVRLEVGGEVKAVVVDLMVSCIGGRSKAMRKGEIIKGWHRKKNVQALNPKESPQASG